MGMPLGTRYCACLRFFACLWPVIGTRSFRRTRAARSGNTRHDPLIPSEACPALAWRGIVCYTYGSIDLGPGPERGCAMFAEIAAALGRGEPVALVTVVKIYGAAPCAPGARLLVRADGGVIGTLGGASTDARAQEDALHALASGEA